MPRILLVEDENIISEPISIVLRLHEYDVDLAGNGLEALKLCKKHHYDLILLDIIMPFVDGVEFLKKAELKKTAPSTKVIVMSNLAMGAEIKQALKLGAVKNILKASITPSSLLEMVREEIGQSAAGQKTVN